MRLKTWDQLGEWLPDAVREELTRCTLAGLSVEAYFDESGGTALQHGRYHVSVWHPWEGPRAAALSAAGFVKTTPDDPRSFVDDSVHAWTWYEPRLEVPWTFRLVRVEDAGGVSGTGHVADGVLWPDGTCALRWRTEHASTAVYASLAALEAIHGHGGKTRVEWYPQVIGIAGGTRTRHPSVEASARSPG